MRTFRKTLLLSALMAPILSFADAPSDGWYVGLFTGVADIPKNVSISGGPVTIAGVPTTGSVNNAEYKVGFHVAGSAGYKSGPVRYEAELKYAQASAKSFDFNGATQPSNGLGGQADLFAVLLNLIYDFDNLGGPVSPFLGAGIGYAHLTTTLTSANVTFDQDDNELAYQGIAGVTYNINNNTAISLAYHYLATTISDSIGKRFQTHIGSVGFTYRFDNA